MGKVIKDLIFAVLNATLILIALCLFFIWQIAQTADDIAQRASQAVARVAPVQTELVALRQEVAGLRDDVTGLRGAAGDEAAAMADAVQARIDPLQEKLDEIQARVAGLTDLPHSVLVPSDQRGQKVIRLILDMIYDSLPAADIPPPADR